MTETNVPESVAVPLSALIALAVEHARLIGAAGPAPSAPVRHALRRIDDFLRQCELEAHSMTGKPFDAGLAVRVIDAVDDPGLAEGQTLIEETLSPMVMWRGKVVKPAEVVTRRGTKVK